MTITPLIKIFSRPACNYCELSKQLLDKSGLKYEEYVLGDQYQSLGERKWEVTMEQLIEMVGKPVKTIPQILWNDEHIGGYTDLREKLLDLKLLTFSDGNG